MSGAAEWTVSDSAERAANEAARWAAPVLVFVAVIGMAARSGAYFPPAWGWAALGFAWAAVMAVVLRRRIELGRSELLMLAALVLVVAWLAAGVAWSSDRPQSVLEVERGIVYVTG